jgi:hypothetical protein
MGIAADAAGLAFVPAVAALGGPGFAAALAGLNRRVAVDHVCPMRLAGCGRAPVLESASWRGGDHVAAVQQAYLGGLYRHDPHHRRRHRRGVGGDRRGALRCARDRSGERAATERSGARGAGVDHRQRAAENPASGVAPEEFMQALLDNQGGYRSGISTYIQCASGCGCSTASR